MVDPARVRRLLEALREYRDHLIQLRDLPVDRYVAENAFEGRYLVQASAQTCIDLANHVIASEGWRAPQDFGDPFVVLEENDVLEADLAERLRALAALRSRLVHVYADIDDRRVHQALAEGLDDLNAFARAVARRIQE